MDHDHLQRHCPKLGHTVAFAYCRSSAAAICHKVLDCWWEHFNVVQYFEQRLSPEEFQQLQKQRPKSKMTTILDIIRQARERKD